MTIKETKGTNKTVEKTAHNLKGVATIEFRDAKTGELIDKRIEHNITTDFIGGMFTRELCGTYVNQNSDLFSLVKGIQLLPSQEVENKNNVDIEITGSENTGFGNLYVNSSQTNTKWMSYNNLESGPTASGYRWVWNANENQCNGNISSLCLVSRDFTEPLTLSMSPTWVNTFTPMIIGKWVDTEGNVTNTTFQSGMFSNIVHIDWDNEIIYDIERDYENDKKFTIKRYNMNKDRIGLKYRLRPTSIDSHDITVLSSLNFDYVSGSSTHSRPFSVKVEGGFMYLVKSGAQTYTANTNLLRIIKVNLTDFTHTDTTETLTQTFADMYMQQRYTTDKKKNFHFVKDYFPIVNGYIYLCSPTNTRKIYKVNLNATSDITLIDAPTNLTVQDIYTGPSLVNTRNIFMGQLKNQHTNASYAMISVKENTSSTARVDLDTAYSVDTTTGAYKTSATQAAKWNDASHVFADLKDGMITMAHCTLAYTTKYAKFSGMIWIDQFKYPDGRLTVNNVDPVVKTSDKTMKITYELNEVQE